jgi:hypothetical protein
VNIPGTDLIVLRAEDNLEWLSCINMTAGKIVSSVKVDNITPHALAYVTSCKYEEPGKCSVAIILVDDDLPLQDLLIVLTLDYRNYPQLSIVFQHRYERMSGFLSVALGPNVVAYTQPCSDHVNRITRASLSSQSSRMASLDISHEV